MNFKRLLLFLVAPLMLVMTGCEEQGPDYSLPSIAVTDAAGKDVTTVSFPAEGGVQKFTIAATRSWNIAYTSDWFGINPQSDTNEAMAAKVVEVTITAGENEGDARNETITLTMDKTEKKILISQSGKGQVELGEVLYYENFDKDGKQAQKGDKWSTYLDSEAGQAFLNPTPESQANVTYAGQSVTVRSNSANGSAGTHSNCADVASGLNYVWFGTAPTYMTVSGISLAELEGNALTLSFTTERYEYEAEDNTFKNDEFKVYISADGAKWSEVKYTFLEGVNLNGKWNIATAQFNLKEVPETLSLYFTANVGAAYAIDDIKLTAGGGGAEIDLAQGGEISAGGNQGGGGFIPSGEFIYFDNFDKIVAAQGSNGWPYMSAEYGNPMPESQTGVTYNSHGVTARNNSNSDGTYSDIAEASGLNNVFFGKENYLTISGISLAELTGNALTVTFAGDKYQKDGDSNFSTEEFKVYISGDGEKWTLLPYTFAGTAEGRWNTATAQFTLKEVPATLSFYFTATVASVYRLDDLMIVAGGTGAELDLSQGTTIDNAGGGDEPEQPGDVVKATVAEFLATTDENTVYELTGTIKGTYNTEYGNFYLEDATGEVLIYGIYKDGEKCYTSLGLKDGDTITVQGKHSVYNDKVQMKSAEYISHTAGQGGTTPEQPGDVVKATVAEFLATTDESTVYELTGEITGTYNTDFGNFYLKDATGEVLIYGIYKDGSKCYTSLGLKDGDTVTVQGKHSVYNDKVQMKNAEYISHTAGQGGTTPEPAEGPYASDAAFVQSSDNSSNSVYSLKDTKIGGQAVTGFKLGVAEKAGVFTSAAIGVSGDLYLNFYAVAWKNKTATLYYRVNGGEAKSQVLNAHAGATGNAPFVTPGLTAEDKDHYSVLLTGLTATDIIEFSTDASFSTASSTSGRAIVFGVKLTEEALGGESGGTTPEPEEPETPAGAVKATVAEFLATTDENTIYELTGTIKDTYNTEYGNFYLEDATGEVLIYGIYKDGSKCYTSLGLKDGDTITVQGKHSVYNNKVQMKNAEYISHTAGQGGTTPEPEEPEEPETPTEIAEISVADFLKKDVNENVWYKLTGTIANIANAKYGNFTLVDETGDVYVYGLTKTQVAKNDESFSSLGLKVGDIVTLIGTRAEYGGAAQVGGPAYYVSHIVGETPETPANVVTISFADLANRTSFTADQQVWEQNGITVTNDKASSNNDVANYSNPARFYAGSNITIETEKAMSQIVFNCADSKNLSLSDGSGYTVSGSGTYKVTITLTTPATSFTITKLSGQVRASSIEVTIAE